MCSSFYMALSLEAYISMYENISQIPEITLNHFKVAAERESNKTFIDADEHLSNNISEAIKNCLSLSYDADLNKKSENESLFCGAHHDGLLCWKKTKIDTTVVQSCFKSFLGVNYDVTNNASRYCGVNGKWDISNYQFCVQGKSNASEFELVEESVAYSAIYMSGYFISLSALIIALVIFLSFKDLRCLRNTIHINLFLTFILSISSWVLTLKLQMLFVEPSEEFCHILVVFLHYFTLTNFFWHLSEGLYLYMLVVQTFSGDNIKFNLYFIIGWGFPSIFVAIWIVLKAFHKVEEPKQLLLCKWMTETKIDWIIHIPAAVCLIINFIFLIRIMFVLITKLRSANNAETRQYLKASKALLVLIPLLGINYLLVIIGPHDGHLGHIFAIVRAIILSIQGFCVALFFCFFNSEVRQACRHRFNLWRDSRNLRGNSVRSRRNLSKEYRSRTESVRVTTHEAIKMTEM